MEQKEKIIVNVDTKLCPKCNKNEAGFHPLFGVVDCEECTRGNIPLTKRPEFYNQSKKDRIQPQRDKYWQDTEPPFIGDKPNPEFVKINPDLAPEYFEEEELKKL